MNNRKVPRELTFEKLGRGTDSRPKKDPRRRHVGDLSVGLYPLFLAVYFFIIINAANKRRAGKMFATR